MELSRSLYSEAMSARYDADFDAIFGGPDRGDLELFTRLAVEADGPVCEVGAGTGRVLLPVAAATTAAPVVGVEPSDAMREALSARVAAADPRVAARIAVRDGTFTALPLPDGSQALVYSAFRSFQHVLEVSSQLQALRECRRVLRVGGTLAIDLFDPDYRLLHDTEPELITRYRRGDGAVVERWDARRVDRVRQHVDVLFRWQARRGRQILEDVESSYAIRYTFPHELAHLLARAGFEDARIYGDYDLSPVTAAPRELIVIATRTS
ncbi:MAG: SAM-dependent methyltransferase [Deltaproteobacteria bacterium]|nr:MAG: SAM-dependent methyltransferase [Deltaproteobacteria bacterium]